MEGHLLPGESSQKHGDVIVYWVELDRIIIPRAGDDLWQRDTRTPLGN